MHAIMVCRLSLTDRQKKNCLIIDYQQLSKKIKDHDTQTYERLKTIWSIVLYIV